MIGPIIMLLVGLAFLPLSPLFGAMLIIASVVILPFSRKMDAEIVAIEAANPMPARDPVNGCFSFALGAFGIVVIIAALTLILGIDL